ncbi:MAG TPA: T9SS type A sorting domain-containing protein [Flavisolibacter sp.]
MKNTLFFSILLCAFVANAQGPQQLVTVPYNTFSSAKAKGWLYLPADYSTSTTKYPVVIYYHGLGEAGTDPNLLLGNGIPKLIANGMRPDNITNPVDGKKYSFIVLSLQHWSWSPDPAWLPFNLQWLKQNYRVDTNRVYVTGMSAGGQQSFRAASNNDNVSRLVAAAVSMSPANVTDYDPMRIEQNKIETWFFSGNTDGNYTVNATKFSTDCNTAYPGSSKLNIYSGGHCCWNTYYNTNWRDPGTNRSIWEFMLMNTKEEPKVLPVNFTGIDIFKQENGVKLVWKVGQEENVSRYEVEESRDGKQFSRSGEVVASGLDQYSFADGTPSSYYRVKSIDMDGSYKYSMVARYGEARSGIVLRAFPVPAQNELTLQHPTAENSGKILLHAMDGSRVRTIPARTGTQQTTLDLSMLRPGSYFIRYQNGNENSEALVFTKQ